jgi:hypothetical protein
MSSSLAVKRLALHILPSAHIAAQWCKGKCLSAPGARVATWPCHLCGLVSHLSSRSNRTSFQLPLPKDSISATLFSRPLPNALISSRGALSSRRVALPSRNPTPHARCSCSARRPCCADDHHGIAVAHKQPVSMSSRPSCGMRSQSRLPHSSAYSLRPDHHPQTASALSSPARTPAPAADLPLPRHIVSRQGQASAKRQACQRSHPNDQANISLLRLTIRAVQMALQHQPQRFGTPQRASHLAPLH